MPLTTMTMKLIWTQNYERPGTHSVYDGTMRYFTTAPEGASMDDVATAFLSGYDDGGTGGDVTFTVYRPSTDEEIDYTGKPDGIAERK